MIKLCLLSGIIGFAITEPIDTEKFTFKEFIKQNSRGFKEILVDFKNKTILLILLVAGSIYVILWEVLDDVLALEWGFDEKILGVALSIMFLISSATSYIILKIKTGRYIFPKFLLIVAITGVTLAVSSLEITIALGLILFGVREITRVVSQNYTSIIVNKQITSKNCATTLSTYYLIRRIPFLFFSFIFIPLFKDIKTTTIATVFGLILLTISLPTLLYKLLNKNNRNQEVSHSIV